ncbi:MAG TPA: hypothetical protein PKC91_11085 [Ignavibacteria bacterium]|jgi:hypothetical protein|nr:hypothetical protein [Ignavibacteria bacterium]
MDQNQPPLPPQPPAGGGSADKLSTPLTILSFCIPLAGAIIYFMKKDKEPLSAKTACTAAIIGIVVGIASNLLYTIFNR